MTTPRPIQEDDLAELAELLNGIFRLPRGIADQSMLTDFPLVFPPSNFRNSRVIVRDDRLVSHAAMWPRDLIVADNASDQPDALKAAVIVAVATLPEHRMQGHAADLMRDLQQTLHDEEYDLGILWTGVPDFYRKLGWETVTPPGSMATIDPTRLKARPAHSYEVAPYDPARHLDGVMRLHERERVRFARSRHDYQNLLSLPKVPVSVAMQNSQVAAYLVHGQAVNKRGFTEYGGELPGITALICHAMQGDAEPTAIPLHLFPVRPDLAQWAQSVNLTIAPLMSSKGIGHEMIYPVRPERISRQVRERLFVWGLEHA